LLFLQPHHQLRSQFRQSSYPEVGPIEELHDAVGTMTSEKILMNIPSKFIQLHIVLNMRINSLQNPLLMLPFSSVPFATLLNKNWTNINSKNFLLGNIFLGNFVEEWNGKGLSLVEEIVGTKKI
jgi:hypothetical protein